MNTAPLLFDRACPLTRDPFLIRPPIPNPPSRLKPGPHLSSMREEKKEAICQKMRRLFLRLLSYFSLSSFYLYPLPLSVLFINEYTTLDTKDLTSNELGNPFSHFWLPIPKLCIFQRRRTECGSQMPSCLCSSALWPSVPRLLVPPGDGYRRSNGLQRGAPVPGPRRCPLALTINSTSTQEKNILVPSIKIIYPGTVAFLKAHRCFPDGACPLNFKALYLNQG